MGHQEIQNILSNRQKAAVRIGEIAGGWSVRFGRVSRLRDGLKEMKKVCLRARSDAAFEKTGSLQELELYLDALDRDQAVRKAVSECRFAEAELKKLQDRFNRKTLNIAVAGVGRCGKSTALKAIIGADQDDNSVIPSGSGPAVTAGKSVIRCVTSAVEERTEVEFHTAESFLNGVVNPLLTSISLGNRVCTSLEQFEDLDFDLLKAELEANGRTAEATVRALKSAPADEGGEDAKRLRLAGAQAYAGAFKLYLERLNDLRRIMSAFPVFRDMLTGKTETVPIHETSRYVSYPKDGGPAICYAVRSCRIFSRFPNNEVAELELTDLPGLGTGSESEKKCFFDGFDYSVDLALAVRRPEGLFQNFTTEDDLTVLNVLGAVFGEEHLHECMMLFQNDGGLSPEGANPAFSRIEEWNAARAKPVKVVRGDAYSAEFMQRTLLPEALKFLETNLPTLDAALSDAVLPTLETRATELDARLAEIERKLRGFMAELPATEGANAVADKATEILNGLMSGLNELMVRFGDVLKSDARPSEALTQLANDAKAKLQARYDESDERQVKSVSNSIQACQSALPFVNGEVHAMRILIGEVFSQLGAVHADQLADMRQSVADEFAKLLPSLVKAGARLDDVLRVFDECGCCPEIADAVRTLVTLDAPFYNIIYPDIRKEVFDAMSDVEKNFIAIAGDSPAKKAAVVMRELRNTGENWIWKTERLLRAQSRIPDIVCAAIERFQDRIVRNKVARRELVDFLERNWSLVQSGGDSYAEDIRTRIGNLTK